MSEAEDEQALERIEAAHDDLEEIVGAAEERDGKDYLKDLRIRARKVQGLYYLSLLWYRADPPPSSVVYAPAGWWMTRWRRSKDKNGAAVWETALERE